MLERSAVVIVGGGAAGWITAEVLRREGHRGSITMLSDEPGDAYDRPPLSKQVLSGEWELEKVRLVGARRAAELDVQWHQGTRAVALDLQRQIITTDRDDVPFDRLVVATGVRARTLPLAENHKSVHTLRTAEDALALRAALASSRRLLVVGAGFLGLEAAATARTQGLDVTVVEQLERPLETQLGPMLAERISDLHRARGVEVITGVGIAEWHRTEGTSARTRVVLSDSRILDADAVLVAVGSTPNTEWLIDSGLRIEDGVNCDPNGRAAENVWAVGDVARWQDRHDPRTHRRFEHRMNANEQARVVGREIMGLPIHPMSPPYFWTDHYDTKIQIWGYLPPKPQFTVLENNPAEDELVAALYGADSSRPAAIASWNAPALAFKYRRELESAQLTG